MVTDARFSSINRWGNYSRYSSSAYVFIDDSNEKFFKEVKDVLFRLSRIKSISDIFKNNRHYIAIELKPALEGASQRFDDVSTMCLFPLVERCTYIQLSPFEQVISNTEGSNLHDTLFIRLRHLISHHFHLYSEECNSSCELTILGRNVFTSKIPPLERVAKQQESSRPSREESSEIELTCKGTGLTFKLTKRLLFSPRIDLEEFKRKITHLFVPKIGDLEKQGSVGAKVIE